MSIAERHLLHRAQMMVAAEVLLTDPSLVMVDGKIVKRDPPVEPSPDDPPFFAKVLSRPDPMTDEERARIARWRAKVREYGRDAGARRRARIAGSRVGDVRRAAIVERDGSTCYLCGKVCTDDEIHLDHIVPLSMGGSHSEDNVAVACARCNVRKGARPTDKRPAALLPSPPEGSA